MSTGNKTSAGISEVTCMFPGCGNVWLPRSSRMPKVCPKCKRYNWQIGRTQKQERKGGKDVKKAANLGPQTKKFLKLKKEA